jgi:hypothetical protein
MRRSGVDAAPRLTCFAPAWQGGAVDQVVQAIRDVERDGLTPADYHLATIEALRSAPDAPACL